AIPVTVELAVFSLLLALVVAIPLAMWTAYREGSAIDRASATVATALISVPPFVAALILIFFFVFHRSVPRYLFLAVGLAVALTLLISALRRSRAPAGREPLVLTRAGALTAAVTAWVVVQWPEFPRIGFARLTDEGLGENLRHLLLPAMTLALTEIAVF